jgi:hydrogenase nickel incorporation protein HypA/HybF
MHELAIAESVLAIATEHAAGRPVRRVELKVGRLRQVVPSSLEFAFQLLADDTSLRGAELVIEDVPAMARCRACGADTEQPSFPLTCGCCGGFDVEVIAGEELLLDALELEETVMTTGGTDDGD